MAKEDLSNSIVNCIGSWKFHHGGKSHSQNFDSKESQHSIPTLHQKYFGDSATLQTIPHIKKKGPLFELAACTCIARLMGVTEPVPLPLNLNLVFRQRVRCRGTNSICKCNGN